MESDVAVPVSVEEIKRGSIEEYVTTTGTVYAIKEADLTAETSGRYRRMLNPATNAPYKLGDRVAEGNVIVTLVDEEYENSIKIKAQKLNLDISQREYEKQQSLYDKGGVTLRELKDAEVSYINAKYAYDNALIQLNKLKVQAPFDGIIVALPYYTPDTKVAQGASIAKLMNFQEMYLEVNMPGKEMGIIKPGQPVRVMNYTIPDDTLYGSISEVSPAIDADTRTFKSAIVIDNPDLLLRPGMFVKAELVVAKNDSALVIPKDVIIARRSGKQVFIVQNGAAMERRITTGLENPDYVEVLTGLEVNDRLVVDGFETLRNRSKVKIIR
ncbi:efflux RND transporter periplasmic adaptor subunit [bacterium]|nr:efflux RND transporter periplasmic adaptor subunit [bacterium]